MTGEEARERVIEAISRAFGPQTRADSALATLGLDWTQAAALMSGEAVVKVVPHHRRDVPEHHLKTWPEFYDAIDHGEKTFEVRLDDRHFAVGDRLYLNRYDPKANNYVKGWPPLLRYVTYILHGGQFGVQDGYCILGIASPASEKETPNGNR